MLPGEIMIKQWWAQQSESLGHWIYRKRLAAMQRRIQQQKALLNGSKKLTADEMHTLRSEILRDVHGHATPDHSMRNSAE
jgi:NADH:ubiquinone oxidoreductase subunit H